MIKLKFPTTAALDSFITQSRRLSFNYPAVGQTAEAPPAGYDFDDNSAIIGQGDEAFEAAKAAFHRWTMFDLSWVKLYSNMTPIEAGEIVTVNFQLFGLWWSNTCEIVYVIDEPKRFGFAYGTKKHVESGEELFLLSINEEGQVHYTIQAFSRPKFWLVKLGYPFARYCQRQFVKGSFAAMKKHLKSQQFC